jgi:hypothetical protein
MWLAIAHPSSALKRRNASTAMSKILRIGEKIQMTPDRLVLRARESKSGVPAGRRGPVIPSAFEPFYLRLRLGDEDRPEVLRAPLLRAAALRLVVERPAACLRDEVRLLWRADDLRDVELLRVDDRRRDAVPVLPLRAVVLRRVDDVFLAELERPEDFRVVEDLALPPLAPPFRADAVEVFLPRPEPLFLPPPVSLFTVAQARRSASFFETPRFS